MPPRSPYKLILLMITLWCPLTFGQAAWSECKTHYNEAVILLDATTQKAYNNEHPDADEFSIRFQTLVDQMQTEKCLPELMNLIKHIQTEQKKYPVSTETKLMPVTE